MIVASTTLSNNTLEKIGAALFSVRDHVDLCIIIDSGITDSTLDLAREICGDKLRVYQRPWDGVIAGARNFALDAATREGADFAITLDTDERLTMKEGWREELSAAPFGVALAHHVTGFYAKERVFKLPVTGGWKGAVHECCAVEGEKRILTQIAFDELAKTPEQYQARFEVDLIGLRKTVKEYPYEARWRFYLGQTLFDLGKIEESVDQYLDAARLSHWDEEIGTSLYRAAYGMYCLGRYKEALETCCTGLPTAPFMAELPWLAAETCFKQGRMKETLFFARMAKAVGELAPRFPRYGFCYRWAYSDGPALMEQVAEEILCRA